MEKIYLLHKNNSGDFHKNTENVNFYDLNKNKNGFVFSDNLISSKFSADYAHCTGITALGKNSKNKQISIFSHQNTEYLLKNKRDLKIFKSQMKYKFDDMITKSIDNVRVLFFGGLIFNPKMYNSSQKELILEHNKYYVEFINFLTNEVKKIDKNIDQTIISPKYTLDNTKSSFYLHHGKDSIIYSNDILPHKINRFKIRDFNWFLKRSIGYKI